MARSVSLALHKWVSGPGRFKAGNPQRPYKTKLGSPPSLVMETLYSGEPDLAWQGSGSSRSLYFSSDSSHNILKIGFGPLGSAPSLAWSPAGDITTKADQVFVYWASSAGYLNEAHYEQSGWHHSVITKL